MTVARVWRGWAADARGAEAYQHHFNHDVAPHLERLAGFQGAWLCRRETDSRIEFMAVSLWESMDAVKGFAGDHPDVAIVGPAGRAALSGFEDKVAHYDAAFFARPPE
jgi:heme-degrading monooxygenase HmoA